MPQLDGLRAFAVAGVLASHFLGRGAVTGTDVRILGELGVRLFFVLSGFLITSILLRCRAMERGPAVRAFYARRFLRIAPIYYAILLIVFAISPAFRPEFAWDAAYLSNVRVALMGRWESYGHLWSLAVEEQFYLVWPWLILFLPSRVLPAAILSAIAIGPIYRAAVLATVGHTLGAQVLPFGCLDILGAGALLALAHGGDYPRLLSAFRRWGWIVGAALMAYALARRPSRASLVTLDLASAIGGAWLVDLAARRRAGKLLEWPALMWLGKVSYGVYLLHMFVFVAAAKLPGLEGRYPLAAVASISTVAVAGLSWRYFEGPINELKSRFPYRRPGLVAGGRHSQ